MLKVSVHLHGGDPECAVFTHSMNVEEFKFFMDGLRNGLTVENYGEYYRYNTNEPYTVDIFTDNEGEDQLYYEIVLFRVVPVLLTDE